MAFVQATCNSTPTGTGTKHLIQAYGSNVASGNLLVVFVCGSVATPTISDTIGTSFGSPVTSVDDSGDGERLQCWVGTAPSSGANTVDVAYSAGLGDGWIGIAEFSGRSGTVTTSGTVLMTPAGTNVVSCPNGSSISIAAHDDLAFAMVVTGAYLANNWSVATGSGFTEQCESGVTDVKLDGALHTQNDMSANASYVAQSQAANRDASVGIVLSLAQSGGGGGGATNHMRRIHPF